MVGEIKLINNVIKAKTEWKLLGSATKNNTITLPNKYEELRVIIAINGNIEHSHSILITQKEVNDGVKNFYSGFFFGDSSNGGVRVGVHDNQIGVTTLNYNKADAIGNAVMRVYYK